MIIKSEKELRDFEPWCGAVDTFNSLSLEQLDELEAVLEELNPDGIDEGELNDIFWFDADFVYSNVSGWTKCYECNEWYPEDELEECDDPYDDELYCEDCLPDRNDQYEEELRREAEEEEEEEDDEDED